ncbi:MAG: hypothetical protein LAP13_12140 [Acidobacteriia bacterium]|nr:hypothetical protein [Terriglobia bacterium]
MKREMPTQLIVGVLILLIGGAIVGGEYLLVQWWPRHEQRVRDEVLTLLPYRNETLGVEMQVAAGIYGKVQGFPGGVRIERSKFWSIGPSLTITMQPNPDQSAEFSPQVLAKWQTVGVTEEIPRYRMDHLRINDRDAVLIRQFQGRAMLLTARIISPDRIIEANCSPGREDEDLYMNACEESLRTIKVAGPPSPQPSPPSEGIIELTSPQR